MKASNDFLSAADAAGYAVKTLNLSGVDWQVCVKKDDGKVNYDSIMTPKPDEYYEQQSRNHAAFIAMVADLGASGCKGMIIDRACSSTPDDLLLDMALAITKK